MIWVAAILVGIFCSLRVWVPLPRGRTEWTVSVLFTAFCVAAVVGLIAIVGSWS